MFAAGGASGALAWRWIGGPKPARTVRAARPASAIVAEFETIHTPGFGNTLSEEDFKRRVDAAFTRQNAMAMELLEAHPRDPRVPELMRTRWCNLLNGQGRALDVLEETKAVLASDATRELHALALRLRAQAAVVERSVSDATVLDWIERAAAAEPAEPATAGYLFDRYAELRTADPVAQARCITRATEWYAKAKDAEEWRSSLGSTLSALGRPVELEFEDALGTGTWRPHPGRPVLVHLWAAGRWDLEAGAADPDVDALRDALPALREFGADVVAVTDAGHMGSRGDPVAAARALGVTWPYAVGSRGTQLDGYSPSGYSSFLWIDTQGNAAAWCRRLAPLLEHVGVERR